MSISVGERIMASVANVSIAWALEICDIVMIFAARSLMSASVPMFVVRRAVLSLRSLQSRCAPRVEKLCLGAYTWYRNLLVCSVVP